MRKKQEKIVEENRNEKNNKNGNYFLDKKEKSG